LCNLSSSFSHRVPPSQDPPWCSFVSTADPRFLRLLSHSFEPPYTRRTQGVRTGFLWIS
jgi:hypothetical protein